VKNGVSSEPKALTCTARLLARRLRQSGGQHRSSRARSRYSLGVSRFNAQSPAVIATGLPESVPA
jgi:hypothetical protein